MTLTWLKIVYIFLRYCLSLPFLFLSFRSSFIDNLIIQVACILLAVLMPRLTESVTPVYLSVYLSVCLSIYLFIYLYLPVPTCLYLPVYTYLSISTIYTSCLCYCLYLPVCNLGEKSAWLKAPPDSINQLINWLY
jgi:hypothetical protein